jgi:hypothetical protein
VETTYSGLVGAIWEVNDGLALDLGVRGAFLEGVAAEEVRLGFTWAIPVWGAKEEPEGEQARRGPLRYALASARR